MQSIKTSERIKNTKTDGPCSGVVSSFLKAVQKPKAFRTGKKKPPHWKHPQTSLVDNDMCKVFPLQNTTAGQSRWQEPSRVHEQLHCSQREIKGDKKAKSLLKTLPPIVRFWPGLELNTRPYTTLRAPIPFTAPQCSRCCHSSGVPCPLLLLPFLWQLQLNFDVNSVSHITLYLHTSGFFGCVELSPLSDMEVKSSVKHSRCGMKLFQSRQKLSWWEFLFFCP